MGLGVSIVAGLFLFFALTAPAVQAAPPARPLWVILTDTNSITHTNNTTHEMHVFANGHISDRFFSFDGSVKQNQIDIVNDDPNGTTIAVLFDQHPPGTVDVGAQGEFTPTTPITLNTNSAIPGYSEDTETTYASGVLPYQVTQRTLATTTNNCVIMDLAVRNTGGAALTGGKLLFMMDIDVALTENGDLGFYDASRRLVYLRDQNSGTPGDLDGFAMGVALLQGNLRGFGVNADPIYAGESYPTSDADIISQLISPTNAVVDPPGESNFVVWLVVNLPDLDPGQTTTPVFSLCAVNGLDEFSAEDNLGDTFNQVVNLTVTKTATPPTGTFIQPGTSITYTISLANTGSQPVYDIVVTDSIPISTSLVTFNTSQGSITTGNGLITATVGRLDPTSPTVTINFVVASSPALTDGAIISNQAFVSSEPIITATNLVTHLVGSPALTLTKQTLNNWEKRLKLTFNNSAQSENLLNFPVLVVLNSSRINYADTQNQGQDIRFVDADGTPLAYEIEEWDEGGDSYVWVKVPRIDGDSNTDYIWLYYDNPLTPDGQRPDEVWQANYVGVWHLSQDPGGSAPQILDSSAVANHGSSRGGLNSADLVAGRVDGGLDFDAAADDFVELPHAADYLLNNGTVEFWFRAPDVSTLQGLWSKDSAGLDTGGHLTIYLENGAVNVRLQHASSGDHFVAMGSVSANTWHYTVFTFGSSGMKLQLNAGLPAINPFYTGGLGTTSGGAGNFEPVAFGANTGNSDDLAVTPTTDHLDGRLDEIRLSNIARSADWIAAQNRSMRDNFITFGSVEPLNVQATPLAVVGTPFTYTITVTNTGFAPATNVVVTDTLPAGANHISGGSLVGGDTVQWTIPTIAPNGGSQQVSFVITTCRESLLNQAYRVVASNEGVTSSAGPPLISLFNPPTIVADFNYNPTQIIPDSDVFFTSTSTTNGGPLIAWDWDFGDGNTGSGSTVTHSYALPGVYTVTLTVTDACGYTGVATNTLEVHAPILTISKSAAPEPVEAGGLLTYTIVAANSGGANATNALISDPVPANTSFVTGSVTLTPPGVGTTGSPPNLVSNLTISAGQSVTVTFTVRVDKPLLAGTIITNTASLSSPQIAAPLSSTITTTVIATPSLNIVKSGPAAASVGQTVVFTFTVTNNGNTLLQNVVVADSLAGPATFVGGDNSDGLLDLSETWLYTAAYTIPPTAVSPLVNIGTVTATDALANPTVATATHTTLLNYGPILTMTKQGPITAFVGLPATFTFTVSHAPGSDGSPVSTIVLTDSLAGPATLIAGDDGDNQLEAGETWIFTASYTPLPTDSNPLVNTGLLQGLDGGGEVITTTASHSAILKKFNAILSLVKTGPATASVNQTVTFTFTVSHAPGSDGSAVGSLAVTDSIAGPATRIGGDDGDNLLELGENWVYVANYIIKPGDLNPLVNIGFVSGKDQENDDVTATGSHTTTLVGYGPVLFVDKDGPARAKVGDTVVYTITVINFTTMAMLAQFDIDLDPITLASLEPGDGSPIDIISIWDTVAGQPIFVGGDAGGNIGLLDGGEGWVYTVSYTVQPGDVGSLTNIVNVTGVDQEGDSIPASATHTVTVRPQGFGEIFLPLIRKK
jgi:uncharacterized repeat protein (TIGR01451 family)